MPRLHLFMVLLFAGLLSPYGCSAGKGGSTATTTASGGATTGLSSTGGAGGATSSSATGGSGGGTSVTTSSAGGAGGTGGDTSTGGAAGAGGGTTTSSFDPFTVDQDSDGWTPNEGDCCDVVGPACAEPALVNPGAFEYPGNGVDDDCDPATLDNEAPSPCSTTPSFGTSVNPPGPPVTAEDLLQAMDLCQFTDNAPADLHDRKWGIINGSAQLLLADNDSQTPLPISDDVQVGVLTSFGQFVSPQKFGTMAAISSGAARALGDPGYVHPKNGKLSSQNTGNYNGGTQVTIQSGYLSANGGKPPAPAACSAQCTSGCDQAFDSVDLRARLRVPTNARSFSYELKFYSAEYPEYLCQEYNDFFVALLKSSWVPVPPQQPLPADGNIAVDAQNKPVSVNNSFFQVCFPQYGAPTGTCPSGTLELIGNGMGGWGNDLTAGGGTEWLTNTAPVVPGETIELQFIVWDAGDHNVDSLVLLDHFRWSVTPSPVGIHK